MAPWALLVTRCCWREPSHPRLSPCGLLIASEEALESPLFWNASFDGRSAHVGIFSQLPLFPAVKLAVAITYCVLTGGWPRFGNESPAIILVAMAVSTPFQAGEEVGWRGYALPRMAGRLGFGLASVVLGAVWGLWHLPLFFVPGEDYGQPFFVFTMGTTALSVAIAWLYVNTKESLLLTMLMHSAVNQTVGIVPDTLAQPGNPFSLRAPIPFYLTVGFLWIAAAYFLVRFSRIPTVGLQKPVA